MGNTIIKLSNHRHGTAIHQSKKKFKPLSNDQKIVLNRIKA